MRRAENRDQLVALLTEAAEIEHSLMCTYLYGAFSLRTDDGEGLEGEELAATRRWRVGTLKIANEEMLHLALANNLLVAVGSLPHYARPNFPVSPGVFPSDVALSLAPFDVETLDHFVYNERPSDIAEADAPRFESEKGDYERVAPRRRLNAFGQDYTTVGELYALIVTSLELLSGELGEAALFCGSREDQLTAADFRLPGLCAIGNLAEAKAAIELIVRQGEGSSVDVAGSHYARFSAMRAEWQALLARDPAFRPWRPVARHPVMRSPVVDEQRVHVSAEPAATFLDAGNACYALSLRLLALLSESDVMPAGRRRAVGDEVLALMYAQADIGTHLTKLPASAEHPGTTAGLTFTLGRAELAFHSPVAAARSLAERYAALAKRLDALAPGLPALHRHSHRFAQAATEWAVLAARRADPAAVPEAEAAGEAAAARLARSLAAGDASGHAEARLGGPDADTQSPVPTSPREGDRRVERVEGRDVVVSFDHSRCIHARFCVTGEPRVFKANTPGEWIYPDEVPAGRIATVARQCPSGAITYERRDGAPDEAAPEVNTMRIREHGPYAFLAPLTIDGAGAGLRATLCRCGLSKNKPYCDGSHVEGGFRATGEPATRESEPLAERAGGLRIRLVANGPLDVTGNLEILSGTGRTVDRVTCARLCRCGRSNSKPFCDLSHEAAGFAAEGG